MKAKPIACIRAEADGRKLAGLARELERSTRELESWSARWQAAGYSVRASILFLLDRGGPLCPCDLSDVFGMSVPAVSQHLKKLREAELVQTDREGVMIWYSLTPPGKALAQDIRITTKTLVR